MKFTEERLTYLLFLYQLQDVKMSLTNMASRLGISKSTLSKVLTAFYQENLLKEKGKGVLSLKGLEVANKWSSDIQRLSEWLVAYTSLSIEEARKEALILSLHLKETTKERMIQGHEMGRFFHVLENVKKIQGEMLSSHLMDGEYPFAFTVYKGDRSNTLDISMANEAFEHPGILQITDGKGMLVLKKKQVEIEISQGKLILKGTVEDLYYQKQACYQEAIVQQESFYIPISYLAFHYNSQERVLRCQIKIKLKTDIKNLHMPEMETVLSILFK